MFQTTNQLMYVIVCVKTPNLSTCGLVSVKISNSSYQTVLNGAIGLSEVLLVNVRSGLGFSCFSTGWAPATGPISPRKSSHFHHKKQRSR